LLITIIPNIAPIKQKPLMKNLFTLLCASALSLSASAQSPLVLDINNAPTNHIGKDTMYGTVINSVPTITECQYCIWDLGQVTLGSYRYSADFTVATGFPKAQLSNLLHVENGPMKYETNLMFAVEASGINTYGERLKRQAFSLLAQTGNSGDSLIIEAQDVTYSAPQVQIKYPATMGSKWNSTSLSTTNLRLTFLPIINNQPAERKSITTTTSEVVGWGSMRIKRLDGKVSGSKPVLQ
jgi:hypothetical protein